ncbi:hypothetical protein SEVIR_3G197566v4 [Setaria viridis]|uniref:Uncharacterized protein n=1 Tax=Setaria viridis TaxID=4556 RepID=A0A4U6VB22_SETVI|nr:hypothetical protein SEVIR_3G197566v2 [Setaria viridis]
MVILVILVPLLSMVSDLNGCCPGSPMDNDDCGTRFETLDLLHKLISAVVFVFLRMQMGIGCGDRAV